MEDKYNRSLKDNEYTKKLKLQEGKENSKDITRRKTEIRGLQKDKEK